MLAIGSFPLTVELLYLQLTTLAFLLTVGAFLLTILAFLLTVGAFCCSGKVRLIRALRACKQRSLTVSKKLLQLQVKKLPPFFLSPCCFFLSPRLRRVPRPEGGRWFSKERLDVKDAAIMQAAAPIHTGDHAWEPGELRQARRRGMNINGRCILGGGAPHSGEPNSLLCFWKHF